MQPPPKAVVVVQDNAVI